MRNAGVGLCTLLAGHTSPYCVDTVNNRSTPRAQTEMPKHKAHAEKVALLEFALGVSNGVEV